MTRWASTSFPAIRLISHFSGTPLGRPGVIALLLGLFLTVCFAQGPQPGFPSFSSFEDDGHKGTFIFARVPAKWNLTNLTADRQQKFQVGGSALALSKHR
jgi:hypothetical protein